MTAEATMPTTRPLIISADTLRGGGDPAARTPPGQVLTKKWPGLQYGYPPTIDRDAWELRVWGLCENPYTIDFRQFMELPQVDVKCDIHCVTTTFYGGAALLRPSSVSRVISVFLFSIRSSSPSWTAPGIYLE